MEDLSNMEDLNAKDKHGMTLLHKAAIRGDKILGEILIEHGADVNSVDEDGNTPLHFAAGDSRSDGKLVKLLIEAGADVNVVNKRSITPLVLSVLKGSDSWVDPKTKLLIEAGADINVVISRGETLLHRACRERNEKFAILLIEAGADVNALDDHLQTPLHLTLMRKILYTKNIVEKLIEAGADVNAKDKEGNTPLNLALRNNDDDFELLLKAGAKITDNDIKFVSRRDKSMVMRYLKEQIRKEADYRYWILKNQESLAVMPADFKRRLSYDAHYREFCKNNTDNLPISEVIALAELLNIKIDPTWSWKELCNKIHQKLWP